MIRFPLPRQGIESVPRSQGQGLFRPPCRFVFGRGKPLPYKDNRTLSHISAHGKPCALFVSSDRRSRSNAKNRSAGWLGRNRLQLPLGITSCGSADKVALVYQNIKENGSKCRRRGSRLCRRYCRCAYTHSSRRSCCRSVFIITDGRININKPAVHSPVISNPRGHGQQKKADVLERAKRRNALAPNLLSAALNITGIVTGVNPSNAT